MANANDETQKAKAVAGTEGLEKEDSAVAIVAFNIIRLIKLYFYTVIEHVRSTDGHRAWEAAEEMVNAYATEAEREEFEAEFGSA
eukprot:SAG31_NODE_13225_length_884_cov_1.226752_1_plen_84_part_01